ncbi:DUF4194 domain-containing protein [Neolewinella antarctica]|uniref:DUF4194 domain-containing protein n=1 Tax=Neolewinella antarctica TaxID=442734 RepID=A0ABX0XDP4_9BACT|nr:DUF4194 domain-containing protein [Neolewinella antarctica]NJC27014.1 hypothetical protein [Neolewinella antarctica]
MSELQQLRDQFGAAAVRLLKGILYRDRSVEWEQLLQHRGGLEDYFATLNLQLLVDEPEGYAYLRQREHDQEAADFPNLMSRRRLSYPQTILLVLLRKRLAGFEAAGDEVRLVLSGEDMVDMMRAYWDELDTNERKREEGVERAIKKLVDFNFLRPIKGERDRYEVRRILKAYLPIEEIQAIYVTLKTYHRQRFGSPEEE